MGEGPAQPAHSRCSGRVSGFNEPAGLSFFICVMGMTLVWPRGRNELLSRLQC